MERYIHITSEQRERLIKVFKTTSMSVWRALRFESDSPKSLRIRTFALRECNGILMNKIPSIQTFHDHDGYMRQYLPNGALIEISKKDSTADVLMEGKVVKHYDQVMISQIENIQNWAQALR